MTEPGQVQAKPCTGRFRFSLRALFLFVFVSGLAFSHLVTSWRLKQARVQLATAGRRVEAVMAENKQLRLQLGQLNIEDPSRLYAVASPFYSQEDLKWRWQVYLPSSKFRMCAAVKEIPDDGLPAKRESVLVQRLPKGECSIEAAVVCDHLGQWQFHAQCTAPSAVNLAIAESRVIELAEHHADWLVHGRGQHGHVITNAVVRRGEPLVLMRNRALKKTTETRFEGDLNPCDGVMLWIEEE